MISNYASDAAFDSKDNLWVATHKGLSYINRKNNSISNYGVSRNIPAEKINDIVLLNDSTLLLATDRGLFAYSPNAATTAQPPAIAIEWVKANTLIKNTNELLHLTPEENDIEIMVSGISFQNSDLEFYYQINDGEWNKISSRLLTFIDMPNGSIKINVKCKNQYPLWSKIQTIELHIATSFYKTWWFITSAALAAFVLLWVAFYLLRKRRK